MIERDDLVMAVGGLIESIDGLRGEVSETRLYGTHNRKLIRLVAVSVAFDICLSAGLYLGFRRADDASQKASKASSVNVVNCVSGNESRRIQTELWNTVLAFPIPAGETPDAKQRREEQTAKFKTYIDKAFAQRDCTKVG